MQQYGREILLKALVGSHNYGLATPESDRDYKVYVLPTFEELYYGKRFQHTVIGEYEDLDIHDVRKLPELLFKANINYLETLASSDICIPNGNIEMKQIFQMRDDIFRMNLPYFYNACQGMFYQKMKQLTKGTEGTQHLVDKYGYDTKQAQHAYRCLKVIVDFAENNFENFQEVIKYSGAELSFMQGIRNGEVGDSYEFTKFVYDYKEKHFEVLSELYGQQPVNLELKDKIDNLVMQMIKRKLLTPPMGKRLV